MFRARIHIPTVLGCLLMVAAQSAFATTVVMPRDEDMVIESRAIVTGKVLDISTALDSNNRYVYTYVRLSVSSVLKGNIVEHEIVLKELGGETREFGTMIHGMPRFELGQEVLLYLNTWPDGSLRVHQGFLGKFNISRDNSGRASVERQKEGDAVQVLAGTQRAGTDNADLSSYVDMISGLVEKDRVQIAEFENRYFAGTPLLGRPEEYDSLAPEYTPMWVLLNPTSPARWFEADSNQPVVFYVNPTGAPAIAQLQEDMQAAMNAWSRSGGSIRVTYGGTTGGCGVQVADGSNTISFNNCDNYFSASQSCSGLLAVSGIIRYMTSQTKRIGTTTYGRAVEANMSFNPFALCNFSNRAQLQEVATHEMGHALGLGHSGDSSATMAAFVHFDNRAATLMPDDVAGITSVYPGGSGGSTLSITTSSLASANIDSDYNATLEASGGAGGYHWDLVGGSLPSGISLAMSGFVFGRTSSSGNFSFTAQVRDSAGNTTQRNLVLVVKPGDAAPSVSEVQYKKKKTVVYGDDFKQGAVLVIDGETIEVGAFDTTRLASVKRKMPAGQHQVYVLNPDGKRTPTIQFFVE